MKITEIPELEINPIYNNKCYVQKHLKTQIVNTPFGKMEISCNIRVPKMSANKRTWKIWYKRFIEGHKKYTDFLKTKQVEYNLKKR